MPTAQAYSNLHRTFLRDHHPSLLRDLRQRGEAEEYFRKVGEAAMELYEDLEAQMMTAPNLPTDHAKRVQALEAIPATVEEIVMHDLIMTPQKGSTAA